MAESAQDYPMTFGYGRTDAPYGTAANPYHKGDDYAMPDNTPVVINNSTTIGFSGNSGSSTGAHLHIGRFVNGQATNPQGQGFTLPAPARVTDVGQDATNGKYVGILDAQGVRWVYLHLNSQVATVGQIIQAGEDPAMIAQLEQQTRDMQSQIDIMRPQLVDANNRIDGLLAELTAERATYEATIQEQNSMIADLKNRLTTQTENVINPTALPTLTHETVATEKPGGFWAWLAKLLK